MILFPGLIGFVLFKKGSFSKNSRQGITIITHIFKCGNACPKLKYLSRMGQVKVNFIEFAFSDVLSGLVFGRIGHQSHQWIGGLLSFDPFGIGKMVLNLTNPVNNYLAINLQLLHFTAFCLFLQQFLCLKIPVRELWL